MEENEARRVTDRLRERGMDAHMERAGTFQFGVRVSLPDGRQAVWDSDGTAGLEAQVMKDGMLVGFVPSIDGSEDYDEAQTVEVIVHTDYDQPIARRRSHAGAAGRAAAAPGRGLPPLPGRLPGTLRREEGGGRGGRPPPGFRSDDHPASTEVDCRTTITTMIASRNRLQPNTLRNSSPSRPAMPTAAAAMARFCGETILPSTPPERVARGHQQRVEPGLVGGADLQRAEQRVGRGVGAGHRDAEPAEDRGQERERAAGAGHPVAQRRGLAGRVHHVRQGQHGHDRDDRRPQLLVRVAVGRAAPGPARSSAPGS